MSQPHALPATACNQPTFISRQALDDKAWDACVTASPQRIVYGYTWYLDAVLPAPDWKWLGLVLPDKRGGYQAVLPVPLRRKKLAGVTCGWVVHQPFFCQFLTVFTVQSIDVMIFLRAVQQRFRYGSRFNLCFQEVLPTHDTSTIRPLITHVLDLSVGYETLSKNYSRDRTQNLRRAQKADWTVTESTDVEPLLTLFRANHADSINGGVAEWSYSMLRALCGTLNQRGLAIIRYAVCQGCIEAGALFVREGDRIIYLFNAASATGRKRNARTLLIDQVIREYAAKPYLFDFESPEKTSIRDFYRSFGAVDEPYYSLQWSRLTGVEQLMVRIRRLFLK